MKKLLIVTGPQGSGNHLFARLFSLHENVIGWESLHDKYWVPSDQEPFARFWVHPEELTKEHFDKVITSVQMSVCLSFLMERDRHLR